MQSPQHNNMTRDSTLQQAAPAPQDVSQYIPTYKQKVGTYMRINTKTSMSSVGRDPSYNYGSVLDVTLREDNEPCHCEPLDSTHEATADDRAIYFENNRIHKRNMRLSLFHLLMSRCQALQCIANASERKPQTENLTLDVHTKYSRIFSFAQEARKVAESLESDALQARSEYWVGRGCCGLRDWQAATMHFTNAIRLDATHSSSRHMTPYYGSLLPHEKEDIKFLLHNATQRLNEWKLRTKRSRKSRYEHNTEDTNGGDLKCPLWTPNRDFKNWAAKQQLERNKKFGTRVNVFLPKEGQRVRKLWKHEIPVIRKRLTMLDDKAIFRRTLNADEWFYILRGNRTMEHDNTSENEKEEIENGDYENEKVTTAPPASPPPVCSSEQSCLEEPRNLDDELQQSGYFGDEETRPPSAGSFEQMIHPDDEQNVPQSPGLASPHDSANAPITLLRINSSEQGAEWNSPAMTPVSEIGSISIPDYEFEDN